MESIKILHFADSHLRDDDLFDERAKCLDFIVETARGEQPELIICAGDVFDTQYVRLDSKSAKFAFFFFSCLADVAPVLVVGGTPSHEGTATEVFQKIKGKYQIYVSAYPEQLCFFKSPPGEVSFLPAGKVKPGFEYFTAVISTLPGFTKQYLVSSSDIEKSNLEAAQKVGSILGGFGAAAGGHPQKFHVIVGHFQVGGALVGNNQVLTGVDIEISRQMLELASPDLVCLGHIHKAQKIGSNIFYSGSTQAQDWGELEDKGFYIHQLHKGRPISAFFKTPSIKRVRMLWDFTKDGFEDLDAFLYAYSREELQGVKVRFDCKVYVDEADRVPAEQIKEFFESAGAQSCVVEKIRIPRVQARSSRIVELERLRDRIVERAQLINESKVPESILLKADMLEDQSIEQITANLKKLKEAAENEAKTAVRK